MLRNRANTLIHVNPFHDRDPFRGWPFVPVQWRSELAAAGATWTNGLPNVLLDGNLAKGSTPVDIVVNDESYTLHLEIPGTKREDVSVEFHENKLTVKGEKKRREIEEGDVRHRTEQHFGNFERSFRLPDDAVEDKMRAHYRDGVLSIEIPRLAPSQPQSVEIES